MLSLVTAVVKPHKLEDVKESLKNAGVTGLTVVEVRGFGRQGGHTETYRGAEYTVDFVPKMKIEMLVAEEDVDRVIEAVINGAQTGKIGDGKIWVTPATRVVRIRTNEEGVDAI